MKVNLIVARVLALLAAIFTAIPAYATGDTSICATRQEADSFLRQMPENLQALQTQAIRCAIDGDNSMLSEVRSTRNRTPRLPHGVYRTDIGKGLALFRSSRFDNDTTPLLVYLHGGGWVIGSINSCTRYCAAMADRGIRVLAVDYRLAPEHPYPAGLDDCRAAITTAVRHLDEWKCKGIAIGGDSSGGNLAISTAMSFPEGTFSGLITFYPVTKAYADNSESWQAYGAGFGLDSDLMDAFNTAYTADCKNPLVSPAEADDAALKQLPPVLMVAAERDILRDQGLAFAERLRRLGKEVTYVMIPGSVHLFITVDGQPTAFGRAVSQSASFITRRR